MECPSCTFQNIPGTQECVRCRTLLNLEGVDFLPPRAASGRLGRRIDGAWRRAWFWCRSEWAHMGFALRVPSLHGLGLSHVGMALVPGLAQIRSRVAGMRLLGWSVLAIWCVMLLVAAATVGSGFSVLVCFAMVSVHCFSISLMLTPALQTTPLLVRIIVGISLYFVVLFGEYWPLRSMIASCTRLLPIAGIAGGREIDNGDVLVYSGPWTRPREWARGDLVVSSIRQGGTPHGEAVWIPAGVNVDRVVARSGDHVLMHAGVLTVNGEEPLNGFGPLRRMINMPELDVVIPERSVMVLPSTLHARGLSASLLEGVSVVPEDDVLGRVMFRLRPWNRAGRIGGLE